jgi:mono/diheme cytochrome c family protein
VLLGARLYPVYCADCHGAGGGGDGPLAARSEIPPANLMAPHLWAHGDGELFWWLSDGMRDPEGALVMPGFAPVLGDDARWALIDFIRARNAGLALPAAGATAAWVERCIQALGLRARTHTIGGMHVHHAS